MKTSKAHRTICLAYSKCSINTSYPLSIFHISVGVFLLFFVRYMGMSSPHVGYGNANATSITIKWWCFLKSFSFLRFFVYKEGIESTPLFKVFQYFIVTGIMGLIPTLLTFLILPPKVLIIIATDNHWQSDFVLEAWCGGPSAGLQDRRPKVWSYLLSSPKKNWLGACFLPVIMLGTQRN